MPMLCNFNYVPDLHKSFGMSMFMITTNEHVVGPIRKLIGGFNYINYLQQSTLLLLTVGEWKQLNFPLSYSYVLLSTEKNTLLRF